MEPLLGISIQFLAEIVFQFLCQLPFEWIFFPKRQDHLGRPKNDQMYMFLFCIIMGMCVGAISLIVIRHNLIYNEIFRFLNLFITPYVVGKVVFWLHDRRTYLDDRIYLFDRFWNAYIFAFCITMLRFIFI